MRKIFSKEKFMENATRQIKARVPSEHLEVLDGKTVNFRTTLGDVAYEVDGEKYYLYPVYPEWCEVRRMATINQDFEKAINEMGGKINAGIYL